MVRKTKLPIDDLFADKSLWEVMSVFPNGFKTPMLANYLAALSLALSLPLLICGRYARPTPSSSSGAFINYINDQHIINLVKSLAGSGLTLSVGILSVIIAGFAIFASGSDARIVKLMILKNRRLYKNGVEQRNGRPTLIFVYSIFIYAMVTFSFLSVTCLTSLAIADTESVPYNILNGFAPSAVTPFFISLSSLLIAQIVFTVSILKSFIWNMFQVLVQMSALRVLMDDRGQPERSE